MENHGKSMENHGKSMLLFELNHVEPTKNMALTCFGKVFSLKKKTTKPAKPMVDHDPISRVESKPSFFPTEKWRSYHIWELVLSSGKVPSSPGSRTHGPVAMTIIYRPSDLKWRSTLWL